MRSSLYVRFKRIQRYISWKIRNIPYNLHWFKWWYQRAKRGYADCDIWSLDGYLNSWLPKALRHLKETSHGHPGNVQGFKTWQNILERIALGFEASSRIANTENWVLNEGQEMYSVPTNDPCLSEIKFKNNWTPEQIKYFRELDKKDYRIFKQGMTLFSKYYMNLWD